MFPQLALNLDLWVTQFKQWLDFMIGNPNGVLRGPLIAFVGITLAGAAIYYARTSAGILFGVWSPKARRKNRIEFAGAGTVWGTDRELSELLAFSDYQRVSGKPTTDTYVSLDAEGSEQSEIKVTRWSSD